MTTGKVLHYRIVQDPDGWDREAKWWLVGGIGYRSLKALRQAYPGRQLKRVKMRPLYG